MSRTCATFERKGAVIKKLLFVLLLVSAPAWAAWTHFGDGNDGRFSAYADLATIRKKGNLVKMWLLYDFKTLQGVYGGPHYLSINEQDEFDCDGERYRILYQAKHSGNMAGGEVVYSSADPGLWTPVAPGSFSETFWKVACK